MKQEEADVLRKFGIALVGDVPWGTHLCQFYETKEDLIDVLVPYFAEGLRNNEFCTWVTSQPLEVEEAKQALRKVIPELDQYIQKGQIEILPYTEWYLLGGAFDADRVLQGWVEKERVALSRGFDGLRLTGNTFWLEKNGWKAFTDYEAEVNKAIGRCRMIAVCTYSLSKCNANEIIDVIKNHQFALVKRSGKWELIGSAENKIIQSALQRSEKKFSALYSSMIEGVAFHDIVCDSSGKAVDYVITDVNPSYQEITGLSRNQVVGKKASELYGTGEPPYLNVYAEVALSGKPATFETYFPPMKKHFSISVFSSSKGKFTTVFHDITERKQAEKILRQTSDYLENLFNYANAPIICWDAEFKITRFNHAFEHLAGVKAEEVIGQDLSVLFPEDSREESLTKIQRTLTGEHWEVVEIPILRKDGGSRIVLWNSANIYAEDGKTLMATIAQGQDITERKKAEEALKESEEKYRGIIETTEEGIWISDPGGKAVFANQKMADMLGYAREEIIGRAGAEFLMKGQEEAIIQAREELGEGRRMLREYQFCRKDGAVLWTLVNSSPIFNDKGQHVGNLFMHTDITERKKTEEKIRSLAKFPSENPNAVLRVDRNGMILYSNPAATSLLTMWNSKLGECLPMRIRQLVANTLAHKQKIEFEEKYGEQAFSFLFVPITTEGYVNIYGVDITERKQYEEALRETRNYLENLIDYANAPIIVWNPAYCITRFNHAFERLTGHKAADVLGKPLEILFPEDSREESLKHIGRASSGEYWKVVEIPILRTDGSMRTVLWNSANICGEDRTTVVATIAQGQDITERKKAEEALRESQNDLNRAQVVAKTGSWRLDVRRNELLWSNETYRMFGIPKGTPLTYETFLDTVHPDDREHVDQKWQAAMRSEPYDIEHRIVVKGEVKWVRERAELEVDKDGALLGGFGTVQDVTERKQMQDKLEDYSKHLEELVEQRTKQLKDAERLAVIGQTAGMVGHDIRNPLQSITGDVYLAKMDLASLPASEEKESVRESLEAIGKQTEYINKIVLDLQDFAKPLNPHAEETDLERLIDDLLVRNGVPDNIRTDAKVDIGAKKVMVDSAYMRRIMGNLVSNALQAMPDGGKLVIRAYREAGDVVITVEDTGVGIPDEAKPRLFQPLFTTKSKGQGFGLAVVKRLTEGLNGTITFDSQEGKGTKFTIKLPVGI